MNSSGKIMINLDESVRRYQNRRRAFYVKSTKAQSKISKCPKGQNIKSFAKLLNQPTRFKFSLNLFLKSIIVTFFSTWIQFFGQMWKKSRTYQTWSNTFLCIGRNKTTVTEGGVKAAILAERKWIQRNESSNSGPERSEEGGRGASSHLTWLFSLKRKFRQNII